MLTRRTSGLVQSTSYSETLSFAVQPTQISLIKMAILSILPGLEANICVDGESLQEWANSDDGKFWTPATPQGLDIDWNEIKEQVILSTLWICEPYYWLLAGTKHPELCLNLSNVPQERDSPFRSRHPLPSRWTATVLVLIFVWMAILSCVLSSPNSSSGAVAWYY